MAKVTNTAAGPRGVNLKDGTTRYLDPGETADLDYDGELYEGLSKGDGGFDGMTKVDLQAHMDERGIAYEPGDNKAALLEKIEAANAAA
jgi:hypothetical protein